jgi:predicted small integral membrane protein
LWPDSSMIKNYLRVAFRNLWRHKGFSLLNIIGLTVGMTAFFLVFLYVSFELSYDSVYSNADRVYRIVADGVLRIGSYWGIFGLAGVTALVIALATASFQAIKAALVNPVKSLRTE